jgi:hypothetical protein
MYIYIYQEILSELVHQQKTNGSLAMTMVQSLLKKRAFASNLLGFFPGFVTNNSELMQIVAIPSDNFW